MKEIESRLQSDIFGFTETPRGLRRKLAGTPYYFRELRGADEFEATTGLQQEVFGLSEREVCPGHMLVTLQKIGGIVVCAFNERESLVRCFSFPMPALWTILRGRLMVRC